MSAPIILRKLSCRPAVTRFFMAQRRLPAFHVRIDHALHACFAPMPLLPNLSQFVSSSLFSTSAVETPDINDMRTADIKKELTSYGISTKSLVERKELVSALEKARAEGQQPVQEELTRPPVATDSTLPRDERIALEMKNCNLIKTSLIKEELQERGIDTKGFFEKSEMVRALAEARVDGISKSSTGVDEVEHEQAEAATDETAGPQKTPASEQQQQQKPPAWPWGASEVFGSNPFGPSFGNPFASGTGGGEDQSSGMADAFRKTGLESMGGAGKSPDFDKNIMNKAEELFKNPEVKDLLRKATENPKISGKFMECLGNPSAMMKYANDPDIKDFLDELRKFM